MPNKHGATDMKKIAIMLSALALSGCASMAQYIPSFWDDNQSYAIVSLRLYAEKIDCTRPQLVQVQVLRDQVRYFQLYSESKGSRQQDVLKVVDPLSKTIVDWETRAMKEEPSKAYCELKKKVITAQGKLAAEAVLGRY